MRFISAIADWLDQRLGARDTLEPMIAHPVPRTTASWWYVFGSATLVLFVLQIVTGICLALVYVPTADQAYQTLEYLNYQPPFGWYLRAMHFWGSNGMVLLMTAAPNPGLPLRCLQVSARAHLDHRRVPFARTLGMAFTGQILRWDQDAYWGLGIGAAIAGRAPLIGSQMVELLLGGPIIAGRTLSRFFALHVFVIPGLLIGLVALHLWLVLRLGINEWPMPGRLVDRATYRQRYEDEVQRDGVPFFPVAAQKDMIGMAVVTVGVLVCAALFGPHGPRGVPDPTLINTAPRPDFYFLALFALFALLPPWTETVLILVGPVVALGSCSSTVPGRDGGEELATAARGGGERPADSADRGHAGRSRDRGPLVAGDGRLELPCRRPVYVRGRTPLELQGALVIQNKQCRNCHSLGGEGGERGPALDGVAHATHAGSAHPPGAPGRREHAGVRQEPDARRGQCARRLS